MKPVVRQLHNALPALAFFSLTSSGCLTPTFETAEVRPGLHWWGGATYGYRSLDYIGIEGNEALDTQAVVLSSGLAYGFSDATAAYGRYQMILVAGGDDAGAWGSAFAAGVKHEATRTTDAVAVSVSAGLSSTALIEARPMIGFRGTDGHEYVAVGSVVSLYYARPLEVFTVIAPFDRAGLALYFGHSLQWLFVDDPRIDAGNVAVGLGLRF